MANTKSSVRSRKRQVEKAAKAAIAEYGATAQRLRELGLYKPKKKFTGSRSQARRVRKLEAEYSEYLDETRTTVVKLFGPQKVRGRIKKQASESGLMATARALFLPKQEDVTRVRVKTQRGSKGKRFDIIGEGFDKETGEIVSVKVKSLTAAPATRKELRRLRDEAMSLASSMGDDGRLRFIVEPHELPNGKDFNGGVSRNSYPDEKFLIRDLNGYRARMPGDMWEAFVDNITVIVTPASMTHAEVREKMGFPPLKKAGQRKGNKAPKPPKGFTLAE